MTTETDQPPLHWGYRILIRAMYGVGVIAVGYNTADSFYRAGLWLPAAIGLTLFLEGFAVTFAAYSTRGRLRDETDILTRVGVSLGALLSAALAIYNHAHDPTLTLAIALPAAAILSLILWHTDVKDRYAPVFAEFRRKRRERRADRRARRKGIVTYAYANGVRRTVAEWRDRTVELGTARRATDLALALAADDARRSVIVGEIMPTSVQPSQPGIGRPGPYPPRIDAISRPVSAMPSQLIPADIDDEHATAMRQLVSISACVRYALDLPQFGPHARPIDVVRWLAQYQLFIKPNTVSPIVAKYKANTLATGPDGEQRHTDVAPFSSGNGARTNQQSISGPASTFEQDADDLLGVLFADEQVNADQRTTSA
jgi:hypothetical protein